MANISARLDKLEVNHAPDLSAERALTLMRMAAYEDYLHFCQQFISERPANRFETAPRREWRDGHAMRAGREFAMRHGGQRPSLDCIDRMTEDELARGKSLLAAPVPVERESFIEWQAWAARASTRDVALQK